MMLMSSIASLKPYQVLFIDWNSFYSRSIIKTSPGSTLQNFLKLLTFLNGSPGWVVFRILARGFDFRIITHYKSFSVSVNIRHCIVFRACTCMSYALGSAIQTHFWMVFFWGWPMSRKKLLVIDNYDSFTYNLVQMFLCFDLLIQVTRNDALTLQAVHDFHPDYLLISPGPKDPSQAGISMHIISHFYTSIPILGVCLGMQCLNECFGGSTCRAPLPVHGKTCRITHSGQDVFAGIPSPFAAARYHSLQVKPGPDSELQITARSDDGVIMGLAHPRYPLSGVQFHPESFLTEYGFQLIDNFLEHKARG